MKRSTTLFLPWILLVLASCGTPAQYSQQRFQDGLYMKPGEEPEIVRLYTEEDFEAMAAANIARKQQGSRDTLVIVLDDPWGYSWRYPYYSYAPWVIGGLGFGTYYWNRWRYGWYDPWYYDPWYGGYSYGWYDPWYAGWYDPWYYGYGSYGWYGPRYGWYDYPYYRYGAGRGGGLPGRDFVYTPRSRTESGGSRTVRPGSGTNYRSGRASGSGSGAIIRNGQGTSVRRSRSSVSGGTSSSTERSGSSSSGYNYSRSREQGYNYSRSYGNNNSNSGNSTSDSRATTRSYSSGST